MQGILCKESSSSEGSVGRASYCANVLKWGMPIGRTARKPARRSPAGASGLCKVGPRPHGASARAELCLF